VTETDAAVAGAMEVAALLDHPSDQEFDGEGSSVGNGVDGASAMPEVDDVAQAEDMVEAVAVMRAPTYPGELAACSIREGQGARAKAARVAWLAPTTLQPRAAPAARSIREGPGARAKAARVAWAASMTLQPRAAPTAGSIPAGLGARTVAAREAWSAWMAQQPLEAR
jgi:hypothetical protein